VTAFTGQQSEHMNYKDELRKMKKHRDKYFPVMKNLLMLHDEIKENPGQYEFTDFNEMIIILELLDLGYLNKETFIVVKFLDDVTRILYNGRYPLTAAGFAVLGERE
jgi:hypothetical protein